MAVSGQRLGNLSPENAGVSSKSSTGIQDLSRFTQASVTPAVPDNCSTALLPSWLSNPSSKLWSSSSSLVQPLTSPPSTPSSPHMQSIFYEMSISTGLLLEWNPLQSCPWHHSKAHQTVHQKKGQLMYCMPRDLLRSCKSLSQFLLFYRHLLL